MKSRVEEAVKRKKQGYNCAQAVLCTYSDLLDMSEEMAFRVSEGLGRGMGGIREGTCGALSATALIVGLKNSSGGLQGQMTKQSTYNHISHISTAFREKAGSVLCVDLLGLGKQGVKHPCIECVRDAARLTEKFLGGFEESEAAGEDVPVAGENVDQNC